MGRVEQVYKMKVCLVLFILLALAAAENIGDCETDCCCSGGGGCDDCTCCPAGCCPAGPNWFCCASGFCAATAADCPYAGMRLALIPWVDFSYI